MRIWAREWKDNHMLRDTVVEDYSDDTRTHKIFAALNKVCEEFDLSHPVWLDSNIRDFKRHAKCRFTQDSFVGETLEFDYLEFMIIEE